MYEFMNFWFRSHNFLLVYISSTLLGAAGVSSICGIYHCLLFDTPYLSSGLSVEQIVGLSLVHGSHCFLGCGSWVRLN